ncbi:MAG TPA: hypothetical protein VMV23_00495 [Candidatus Nanopelagicaceae bacterium]|nr:hypothetical protein [Candidatus Nanopelagicaceae bacterium]
MSFISASIGWALGTVGACASCLALARTANGGASWRRIPAPHAPWGEQTDPAHPEAGVSRVRFANLEDGWAFGPGLAVTHDAGASWQELTLPGAVTALDAVNGRAYAIVARPSSSPGSGTFALYSSPVGKSDFQAMPGVTVTGFGPTIPGPTDPISLHSSGSRVAGFVLLATNGTYGATPVLYGTADGLHWSRFPDPCAVTSGYQLELTSFAMPDTSTLDSLCSGNGAAGHTQKRVMRTTQGRTVAEGAPGSVGDGGQIAAPTSQILLLATASAASWIYRSTDGGATWTTATVYDDGGAGFTDFGCTTATQCVAVRGQPATQTQAQYQSANALIMSSNGGLTWHQVTIG